MSKAKSTKKVEVHEISVPWGKKEERIGGVLRAMVQIDTTTGKVTVTKQGLTNYQNRADYHFENSHPYIVNAVATMLKEAHKLALPYFEANKPTTNKKK